ncbi:MAG: OmpA family protein [Bacteroidales bacterium]|nr:OmpA family protein [Bacteroidales bacterium]
MKVFFQVFVLLVAIQLLQSQDLHTRNRKAIMYYRKGLQHFDEGNWINALDLFSKAIEKSKNFYEAYVMRGNCFEILREFDLAIQDYEKALSIDQNYFPNLYLTTARLYYNIGQYEKALTYYEQFKNINQKSPILARKADEGIEKVKFALSQIANPKPFNPNLLPEAINSNQYAEYMPTLTVDESQIIFTRLLPCNECPKGNKQEDIYTSHLLNGKWQKAYPISPNINSPYYNEGAQTISSDGKFLFFTACNRPDGKGSCDIYMSRWNGKEWSKPRNIKEINSSFWDSQPCLAADGKTLYFVSNRKTNKEGSKHQMDIFVSHLQEDSTWSAPVPLPYPINTDEDELGPYIHPDGITLYFSSRGHIGMGNFDLFLSRKINDSTWEQPINLGYPINTYNDEAFIFVNGAGNKAYFARGSIKDSLMDIYYFELPQEVRPILTTFLKGRIFDKKTHQPVVAYFELIHLEKNEIVAATFSDLKGEFLLALPTGQQYALHITANNYLFYSEHFDLSGVNSASDPYVKDIYLTPIEHEETFVLPNVFFDFDKYELKPESYPELDKLVEFLKKNPSLRIEIQGHTDNVGSREHNMKLSENRAKAVYEYLVSKGIDRNRMSYKGYADLYPIDTNDTPEGRARNRRTQIKIL